MTEPRPAAAMDPGAFADRIDAELTSLDAELTEIDLLVQQARSEADRHEMKRSQTADRVATLKGTASANPADLADATGQLVQLTRRAVMMESQVDVLQGKQKALRRYRDALAMYSGELHAAAAAAVGRLLPAARQARWASRARARWPSVTVKTASCLLRCPG